MASYKNLRRASRKSSFNFKIKRDQQQFLITSKDKVAPYQFIDIFVKDEKFENVVSETDA